ncbi:MAG TPA: carboxypeptidase-like regulatory domain-containing protein [Anaerolineales bacterium]|nr:carboxypeptidase-like regulatory domain-containing protein [Anaerolineales bacterium]
MKIKFVLGMLIVILSTCSTKPAATDSGIEGRVLIGPMCPVVQVGQECPDQPYQAVLTVNSPGGERIVQFQTDEEGRFRIPLEPGEYILHPESPNTLPFAREQTVIVEDGKFAQVIVNYDSGIR